MTGLLVRSSLFLEESSFLCIDRAFLFFYFCNTESRKLMKPLPDRTSGVFSSVLPPEGAVAFSVLKKMLPMNWRFGPDGLEKTSRSNEDRVGR